MMTKVEIGNARWVRIYALCDGATGEPRYVGKTVQYLRERHKAHIRAARAGKRLPVCYWLRKQVVNNKPLFIKLLENVSDGEDWAQRERHWIAALRADGHRLLNLTDGGEGLAGHKFTDEHRERISKALKTRVETKCAHCEAQFLARPSNLARGFSRFCSRTCYGLSQRGHSRPMPDGIRAAGQKASAALRNMQTHCRNGHPLSGENLYVNRKGARVCKTCRTVAKACYRARQKETGNAV